MTQKPLWLVEFLITVIVLVVVGSLVVPAPSVAVTEQPAQAAVAR
jgi:Tfp pilus assembly protein PilE